MTGDLLADLAAGGIELRTAGDSLTVSGPRDAVTPELLARIAANKPELLRLLAPPQALGAEARGDGRTCRGAAGRLSGRRRVGEPDMTWPAELADWVLTLTADDLPAVPFSLAPGRTVVDASRWLGRLQADIRRGPSGPRARYGALQGDIRRLAAICGAE